MSDPAWLGDIRALTFDCYGTLIDWETGILGALRPWADRAKLDISDEELLAHFARAESASERATPAAAYREILRDTMRRIGESTGAATTTDDEDALAESVGDWPAFADTNEALARLGKRCALVIVSNVDSVSLGRTLPRLGVSFDAFVIAELVGAYKPDRRMFDAARAALDTLGVAPGEHLHVAQSLHHDIAPASKLGWRTCWVDRRRGRAGGATPPPSAPVTPGFVVASLEELAGRMGV